MSRYSIVLKIFERYSYAYIHRGLLQLSLSLLSKLSTMRSCDDLQKYHQFFAVIVQIIVGSGFFDYLIGLHTDQNSSHCNYSYLRNLWAAPQDRYRLDWHCICGHMRRRGKLADLLYSSKACLWNALVVYFRRLSNSQPAFWLVLLAWLPSINWEGRVSARSPYHEDILHSGSS